jgi:hypothetical protein
MCAAEIWLLNTWTLLQPFKGYAVQILTTALDFEIKYPKMQRRQQRARIYRPFGAQTIVMIS